MFFYLNFDTRNTRKSIQGSKSSYYSLVPNKSFASRNQLIGSPDGVI